MAKETVKEMLKMIDAKIEHIEDITADNRAIIIKLVKQSNQIVQFLKQLELHEVSDEFENITSLPISEEEKLKSGKMQELKELVEEFMDKQQDLKEFEEELKKNKDKLTPGTIGES
tara:strand:- start:154 stop:501 length:348 start_codon:yes stop_codon:yes gene_type:complete